ncbi:hypothetical protein CRUP_024598 [Coryphaenoides rupestris]|nr:hypothetical protein CRUP_024598 [Coryphaenoides rupestris]
MSPNDRRGGAPEKSGLVARFSRHKVEATGNADSTDSLDQENMPNPDEEQLGSIENPIRFKNQVFRTLLDECLKSASLFSDPTFPADQNSVGTPEDPDPKKAITWLRPKEIGKNAVFVEGTTGTTDICQGQLGDVEHVELIDLMSSSHHRIPLFRCNCWLLAALSCLTMHPKLFVKVVPPGQSLASSYAGIFHFRFWQYGEWVEVVVDDRLPVREGRLLFSYSSTRNEYWSALVEKAYAKLMGSYSSLKGGNITEGMEDFTGGIAYTMPVASRTPVVLWRALTAALNRGSLLSCFHTGDASSYREVGMVTGNGLIKGHAYAITRSNKASTPTQRHRNTQLQFPYLTPLFDTVELCNINPDSAEEEAVAAGGDGSAGAADEEDERPMTEEERKVAEKQKEKRKKCTILVELLQKNRRKKNKINFLYMAFHIYRVGLACNRYKA